MKFTQDLHSRHRRRFSVFLNRMRFVGCKWLQAASGCRYQRIDWATWYQRPGSLRKD